jgi:catechol 2,3-dioxygenase-like lactoylglutathione lyase family enzyme
MSGVMRLARVSRNVSDLDRAVAFYRNALGFALARDAGGTRAAMLCLGEQEIALVKPGLPAQAYPEGSRSCDLWFQHIAIVVADMEAACARLHGHGFDPISEGGPQRLPPNTGSVTAFKFRDPDGHPLELIHFPPGAGNARWQEETGLFLGVDHSAIAVSDVEQSLDFYRRLGLKVGARSVNTGREQARLDALPADVRVNVIALYPEASAPPHLELLAYERPRGRSGLSSNENSNAIAADRLVFAVEDLPSLAASLQGRGIAFVSLAADGSAALLRDPDGHLLRLVEA